MADSSGSKYSADSQAPVSSGSTSTGPPPVASKPVFTPTRSGGIVPTPAPRPKPATTSNVDDDGWGADAPPVTRTQLEKVQPAYQPTRVNLQQLKNENQTPAHQPAPALSEDRGDVVRGGYQPVGKVDIAAIRRQAAESGRTQDDRPAPVKGSYEPIGKVDIAAIRARAQKPEGAGDSPPAVPSPVPRNEPVSLPERPAMNQEAERLTTLPKPKVANKFGGGPSFGGTKPPLPASSSVPAAAPQVGSASRTFADQGGKTPAQLWAERKARERGEPPAPASASTDAEPIQSQVSGQGEWKSSYAGKSWAPVQTVKDKPVPQAVDARAADSQEAEAPEPSSHVGGIRDQFAHSTPAEAPAPPVPQASRPVPVPGLPTGPSEPETEHDAQQVLPSPPPQPRSPTPPTPPVRESSPIQVAMPVGRGVADAHEEQNSPPPALPVQSLQEAVPDEQDLEDDTHDIGRAAAEATVADQSLGGQRALVKYDYEIGEDNEIELREGEYVIEIQQVDEDWWQGKNADGKTGLFPAVYVELVDDEQPGSHGQGHFTEAEAEPEPEPEPTPAPAAVPAPAAASSKGHTAKALYDYEAAEDNELSFPEHATIEDIVSEPSFFILDPLLWLSANLDI